ncbi:hypothetical protein IHZ75_004387 [Salmonella enterica]|nr:hypothetical protein [Salmonella enterica]
MNLLTALLVGYLLSVIFHSMADGPDLEPWEAEEQKPETKPKEIKGFQQWLNENQCDVGIVGLAILTVVLGCFFVG